MKKILFFLLIICIGIFSFVIINRNTKDNDNISTIKVSEVTHSIFYAPFYVAIENGYFKDEGIDIDLLLVSGSDNVAASVLSGDTSIGLAGPESAIFVYNGGEKDYLQVFSGLTKRDGQFIMSRNKDFNWNDLIGKEILVGRSTGMPALSFIEALKNEGIDPKDVNINFSIDFSELSGAFIGGEGDYVNLFEPLATKLENNNNGYVVASAGLSSTPFPYTAFYAQKSFIKNNKDLLKQFTNAINKGLEFTMTNDSNIVAKSIHNQFIDTDIKDLEVMIDRYKEADVWLDSPFIEEEFFNTTVNLLNESNIINNNIPYNDLVINLYE